jgi:hypothetical protein
MNKIIYMTMQKEDISMVTTKVVPITIAVPKPYKDLLRKIALEQSLESDQIITTSQLGREILCAFLRQRLEERSKKEA